MSAGRSFRSLFMAATCATAALGCYLVSLRVASERASLEAVETRIVLAQREVRVLQTEIGTRGRLAQLERWNAKVLALSAPSADQFLSGSFELAKLARPDDRPVIDAPVVLAKGPARQAAKPLIGQEQRDESGRPQSLTNKPLTPKAMLNQASLKTETREVPATAPVDSPAAAAKKSTGQPATAAKPASHRPVDKPGLAAAKPGSKKSVDKPVSSPSKPVTKPTQIAKTDPLAALPPSKPTAAKQKDSTTPR